MMPAELEIETINGSWVARYMPHHPEYSEIWELFNTDTLPTAMTDKAMPEDVLAYIRNTNPGVTVELSPLQKRLEAIKFERLVDRCEHG